MLAMDEIGKARAEEAIAWEKERRARRGEKPDFGQDYDWYEFFCWYGDTEAAR